MLSDEERSDRMCFLWRRSIAKLRGAVKVLEIFGDLNRRLYLYGSNKKQDYLIESEKEKPLPIVLMPSSKFRTAWNSIMMLLMLYTGIYVPY